MHGAAAGHKQSHTTPAAANAAQAQTNSMQQATQHTQTQSAMQPPQQTAASATATAAAAAPAPPPVLAGLSLASAAPSVLSALPSLAPAHLLPPVVFHYLPSQPPPSIVDGYKQPTQLITMIQAVNTAGAVQQVQVRKRFRSTDGVRTNLRRKKKSQAPGEAQMLTASREMPERLDLNVPDSALINQLLALERRIDATIARKHVEMQHALMPPKIMAAMTPQVIRLFLWHEWSHAPSAAELSALGSSAVASTLDRAETNCWMLKMQGHILDADPNVQSNAAPVARCLSNYLSAIVVQIDDASAAPAAAAAAAAAASSTAAASSSSATAASSAAASSSFSAVVSASPATVEWRKHSNVALTDGFELRRRGAGPVHLTLRLFHDFSPPRFRMSPTLARALGFPEHAHNPIPAHASADTPQPFPLYETQASILSSFWEYVKKHALHEPKAAHIKCDDTLAALFGVSSLPVSSLLSFVHLHLIPAASDPIVIPYLIDPYSASSAPASLPPHLAPMDVATPSPSQVQCVDILTYAPMLPNLAEAHRDACSYSGLKLAVPPVLQPVAAKHTDKLCDLFLEMDRCNRRRELLQGFSEAPVPVMQLCIAQQAKEQMLMNGVTGVDDELERRGEYYHAEWVYDAADKYLQAEMATSNSAMQTAANVFANADTADE